MAATARDRILKFVIDEFLSNSDGVTVVIPDDADVDDAWDMLVYGGYEDDLNDIIQYDFRCSGEETDIPCETSRHYESYTMARNLGDVSVAWTYWYGGGKHGEPDAIDWLSGAFFVNCEEVVKTVNVYSKIEGK